MREMANFKPKFIFTTECRHAESVMQEKHINALPIVDDEMHILDVIGLHESVDLANVTIRELKPDDLQMVLEFFDQMADDTRAMFVGRLC